MKRYDWLVGFSDGTSTLFNDSLIFSFQKGAGLTLVDSENHSHLFYPENISSISIVEVKKKIFNEEEAA